MRDWWSNSTRDNCIEKKVEDKMEWPMWEIWRDLPLITNYHLLNISVRNQIGERINIGSDMMSISRIHMPSIIGNYVRVGKSELRWIIQRTNLMVVCVRVNLVEICLRFWLDRGLKLQICTMVINESPMAKFPTNLTLYLTVIGCLRSRRPSPLLILRKVLCGTKDL